MKTSEFRLKKDGYNFNCDTRKARQHYQLHMSIGSVFPSTPPQARYFISKGICLGVLNGEDVETVETLLNKHGFEGDYKFTKSKTWVRLQNNVDLHTALKLEYNL